MVRNVGIVGSSITIDKVAEEAFCPSSGVKTQFTTPTVEVEITEGFQVPVIPLIEAPSKIGAILFRQSGKIGLNMGTFKSVISTDITTGLAHKPAFGIKV